MKQLRIFFAVSLLAVLLALCGGCRRTDEIPEGVPEYTVYYLDSPGLKLVGNSIGMEGTDQEALVQELLSRMETVPAELDCQSAIPERVETITFRIEENVLYLFVDANYALMDSVREILCRAALTKTLTQIQGIDYLSIYCAEQPIVDGTGNPVGMLSASDFVEGIRDVNSFGADPVFFQCCRRRAGGGKTGGDAQYQHFPGKAHSRAADRGAQGAGFISDASPGYEAFKRDGE